MKKLKLNMDELKVESFETSTIESQKNGTVKGFATQEVTRCFVCTEIGDTCDSTCIGTCDPTCPNTCVNTCQLTCFTCIGHYTCHDKIETCHPECN